MRRNPRKPAPRRRAREAVQRRVVFPYLKDNRGRYAPLVYLQAWTGNRWLYLQAYVDSGASWTIFHADVASLLGINLARSARRSMMLGNGTVIPIFLHQVRVRFAGKEFTVPAGFSDDLQVGFNVLGRAGFFDRFVLSFNDRARLLTATPIGRTR